jgi:hypothetical protein
VSCGIDEAFVHHPVEVVCQGGTQLLDVSPIQLDPIQRLAGLMIDPEGILRAPRRCKHRDDCFRAGDVSSVAPEG